MSRAPGRVIRAAADGSQLSFTGNSSKLRAALSP
jgi:hypothetical protein